MKNRAGVSIEDIARAAGVSHSTVSRALRGSSLIRAEVRERIQELAREMNYVPNGIAQSLQNQRTNTIGLVVTSISDPFFGEVARGVEEVAQRAGFSLLLNTSHNNPSGEIAAIETFYRRRVDGILVADSHTGSHYKNELNRLKVPTILINNQAEGEAGSLNSISIEDRLGARLAVEHLIEAGHRAIGYLGAANRPRSNQVRLEGYREALARAGLAQREEWVIIAGPVNSPYEDDPKAGREALLRLITAGVSAVFCHNDMLAVGALLAAREKGRRVPGDLSIVGFDDIALTRYVTPSLTTVHQPMLDLGRGAMEMLLALFEGKKVEDRLLKPFLVPRESSGPPGNIPGFVPFF